MTEALIRRLKAGEPIDPSCFPDGNCTIDGDLIREWLIGMSAENAVKITSAGIQIIGTPQKRISITGGTRALRHHGAPTIDLSYLAGDDTNALPPLVLRHCDILGELSLAHSRFAALAIDNCAIQLLDAHGAQIDGECHLRYLRPRAGNPACQILLMGARVGGTLDLRGSRLKSNLPDPGENIRERPRSRLFALSVAGAEISGGMLMTNGFQADGGISLYQATIRDSVRLRDVRISGHDPLTICAERIAIDADEMKLGGSFFWGGKDRNNCWTRLPCADPNMEAETAFSIIQKHVTDVIEGQGEDWQIDGRLVLNRVSIGGDLHLENCRWRARGNGSECMNGGGVDVRYATVGGHFRIALDCLIGRRGRVPSGLLPEAAIGPAIDCWKTTFARGIRIEERAILCGPLLLNQTSIDREVHIAAVITTLSARNDKRPYCQALDLSDCRISGVIDLIVPLCEGRASFLRTHVDGSIEITRIGFRFPGSRFLEYRDDRTSILDFQDLRITGSLNIHSWAITMVHAGQSNSLSRSPNNGPYPADNVTDRPDRSRFLVDLRGLWCDSYDDSDGRAWAPMCLAVSEEFPPKSRSPIVRYFRGDALFKGDWPWRLRMDGIEFNRLGRSEINNAPPGRAAEEFRLRTIRSYFDNRPHRPETRWRRFLASCRLHTTNPRSPDESERRQNPPQPYEIFASGYFRRGEIDAALFLIIQRNWAQWWIRQRVFDRLWSRAAFGWMAAAGLLILAFVGVPVLKNMTNLGQETLDILYQAQWVVGVIAGLILFSPLLFALFITLFGALFGFGLKPRRALMTFVLAIGLVTVGSYAISLPLAHRPILKAATEAETREIKARTPLADEEHMIADRPTDRLLYAFDILVPIIDLEQEQNYRIPEDANLSRLAKGLIEILGWILTSLTLLTLTGVLRRDIDRSK